MLFKTFNKLFNRDKHTSDLSNSLLDMENLVINRFREISENSGGKLAPTDKTTNDEIIKVYKIVLSKFREAAKERDEHIPANVLNHIAFFLLQIYEMTGEQFFLEHLDYQINFYLQNGLRDDYKQELNLF